MCRVRLVRFSRRLKDACKQCANWDLVNQVSAVPSRETVGYMRYKMFNKPTFGIFSDHLICRPEPIGERGGDATDGLVHRDYLCKVDAIKQLIQRKPQ